MPSVCELVKEERETAQQILPTLLITTSGQESGQPGDGAASGRDLDTRSGFAGAQLHTDALVELAAYGYVVARPETMKAAGKKFGFDTRVRSNRHRMRAKPTFNDPIVQSFALRDWQRMSFVWRLVGSTSCYKTKTMQRAWTETRSASREFRDDAEPPTRVAP
jgi:hypothetical protein